MSMPHHYKEKRERLNVLLSRMDVPRNLYFQMKALNQFVFYQRVNGHGKSRWAIEALNLIHEICPFPLVRLHTGAKNEITNDNLEDNRAVGV